MNREPTPDDFLALVTIINPNVVMPHTPEAFADRTQEIQQQSGFFQYSEALLSQEGWTYSRCTSKIRIEILDHTDMRRPPELASPYSHTVYPCAHEAAAGLSRGQGRTSSAVTPQADSRAVTVRSNSTKRACNRGLERTSAVSTFR